MAWPTRLLIRTLQMFSLRRDHLHVGRRGETEAYVYLQRLGYRFVATNFRVPHNQGEIDLIAWDGDVLCFVEVKTRGDASFAPPSQAVGAEKEKHILSVARRYLRRMPGRRPRCRFDVVSIVDNTDMVPEISLIKGAYTWDERPFRERRAWDFAGMRRWRRNPSSALPKK